MSEQTTMMAPVGAPVRCTGCGHTMAADQRYCLDCGKRRGEPRVDFNEYMDDGNPTGPPPVPPIAAPAAAPWPEDHRPVREITPLMAAGGLAAFAVILLLGVIVGRLGGTESQAPVIAATGVPTTTAAPGSTGATSTDVNVAFTSDWPSGEEGFTIELATLPSDSTDGATVELTKTDLASKGAPEVGALESDEFISLPAGNYVFYTGVYDARADAEKALKDLSADFPDAQVIEISSTAKASGGGGGGGGGNALITDDPADAQPDKVVKATKDDLEAIDGADAEDFQELQQKLPPTIETPGEALPPDGKAPGGGGGGNAVELG